MAIFVQTPVNIAITNLRITLARYVRDALFFSDLLSYLLAIIAPVSDNVFGIRQLF